MRKLFYLLVMAIGLFMSSTSMAQDIYLKINGIEGDVIQSGFLKQVEAMSFSQSANGCPVDVYSKTACKVVSSGFQFSMRHSIALRDLKKKFYEGLKISEIEVSFVSHGETPSIYYRIVLKDVLITTISESGSGGELPYIFIEFGPGSAEWFYYMQSNTGTWTPAGSFGWNFVKASPL